MLNPTKIYPAIDIMNGQCVRLTKGDYNSVKVYDSNPTVIAKQFEEAGAKYLHVVDLDAAKDPAINNRKLIAKLIKDTNLKTQTGGGIRTKSDVDELIGIGADRIILGSVAVTQRDLVYDWISFYGSQKIVIGADVKNKMIATHGWLDISKEMIYDFIRSYMDHGATVFLCTDIAKDGMLSGCAVDLYDELINIFPDIGIIASGGVSSYNEIDQLKKIGVEGIIVGKAIYEGKIKISDLF